MTVTIDIVRLCARRMAHAWWMILAAVLLLSTFAAADVSAQQRYSKSFPARKNVRLRLTNWNGSIRVAAWNRDEIKIQAELETPAAKLTPIVQDDSIEIDIKRDNRGEVGSVNFIVWVPVNSTVDVETRVGDITVNGVQGTLVRAHVSTEGDVTLTGIRSYTVIAENISGNILFDGELQQGGNYGFSTTQGNISIRIPANSAFRLNAMAPGTRNIVLGGFSTSNLMFIGEGRKVVGNVGDGRATVDVRNQRGSISFFRR